MAALSRRRGLAFFWAAWRRRTEARPADQHGRPPRIAFVGLHGGVFEVLQSFAGELGLSMDYLTDEQIHDEAVDLARYRLVFLQHARGEDRDHLQRLILSAKNRRRRFSA